MRQVATLIMQQFLYRIQPARPEMLASGPTPLEASVIDQHFLYLQRLVAEGVVFLAGRTLVTDEPAFGIVILQAPSEVEAIELMQNDPVVSRGVMAAELFPYRIALWSPVGPLPS